MSLWRQITRGFRVLANRDSAERDVTPTTSTGTPKTRRYPFQWKRAANRAPASPTRIGSGIRSSGGRHISSQPGCCRNQKTCA